MKKKYTTPTITVVPMDSEQCQLLAGSGNPDTGMELPKEPTPGVEGDAKEGILDFDGFYLGEED